MDPVVAQCAHERHRDVLLTDHVSELSGPIGAVERERRHAANPSRPTRQTTIPSVLSTRLVTECGSRHGRGPDCAGQQGPLAHPVEPTYPCCLPALGEFSRMTPHEGSATTVTTAARTAERARVPSWAEDSPSGLGRTLGKRVGGNPSRVRISYPPPVLIRADLEGRIRWVRPSCLRRACQRPGCVAGAVTPGCVHRSGV